MRAPLIVTVACLLAARPAHAGGGFLPPIELELGRSAIATPTGGAMAGTELFIGLSWASIYPHPTPVDFSAGWHGSFIDAPTPTAGALARTTTGPTSRDANGGFLALDLRLASGPHWRTWLGARGELLATDGVGALGGAGRLAAELWHPVAAGERNGVIFGTVALEAWAELGVRERADRSLATVVAAGLGLRLPLVVAGGL